MTEGPSLSSEIVKSWASDWADQYDQSFADADGERLHVYVGKVVRTRAVVKDEPKGYEGFIVGFSVARVFMEVDEGVLEGVYMASLITYDGLAVPLFAGVQIEVIDGPKPS